MRKTLLTLSLALLLGGASAVIAQADGPQARNPALLAQASPDTRPFPTREGRGPAGRRAPINPEQAAERRQVMCEDRADRLAGQLAYLEALLDLTAAQRPAFNRWRDVRLAAAQRQAGTCAERAARGPNATRPNPVEQMARQEEMLRQRLADLSVQRPALEALYNSLSAEQREKFRPVGGLGGGRGMGRGGMRPRMAMMMRDRLIQRGPQGGRGLGRGPGMGPPPGGPGAQPPAQ
jgi:hypothetical protein